MKSRFILSIPIILCTIFSCQEDKSKSQSMDKNEKQFWEIIDKSNIQPSLFDKAIEQQLMQLSLEEIINFECTLRKKIIEADHYDIMGVQKILTNYVSDDTYFDFRCQLISLGKEKFHIILENPDSIVDYLDNNRNINFPNSTSLFYLPTKVYELKTNRKEDENFPREICSQRGFDYYSTITQGKDWELNDLKDRLPNLWNKVMEKSK